MYQQKSITLPKATSVARQETHLLAKGNWLFTGSLRSLRLISFVSR